MIYEQRTYDVKPGRLAEYLKLFEEVGMPVRQHYGRLIGFWFTEFGPLSQVVHIWAYESLDQRAALRTELERNTVWTEQFLPRALPMLDRMSAVVLRAAPFSPLK
jgi:NIPSNAP